MQIAIDNSIATWARETVFFIQNVSRFSTQLVTTTQPVETIWKLIASQWFWFFDVVCLEELQSLSPCTARSSTWKCHVYESYLVRFQRIKEKRSDCASPLLERPASKMTWLFRPLRGLFPNAMAWKPFVSCSGSILQYLQKALRRNCLLAFRPTWFWPSLNATLGFSPSPFLRISSQGFSPLIWCFEGGFRLHPDGLQASVETSEGAFVQVSQTRNCCETVQTNYGKMPCHAVLGQGQNIVSLCPSSPDCRQAVSGLPCDKRHTHAILWHT